MIKILHYGLSAHKGGIGGIETYLLKMATNINRNQYQLSFLITDDKKPCFYEELQKLGCKFYFTTSRRKNFLQNKKELINLLKYGKFDIIHCHQNSLSYITPILIALRYRKKIIVHSRNASISARVYSKVFHTFNYYRLQDMNVTRLAVSDLAGEWMFGKKKKFITINNGVDINKFRFSLEKREKIRKEFGIKKTETLIIHVGTFRKQKNHSFLVDIFYQIQKQNKNTKLLLVGVGALESIIRERVSQMQMSSNVIFAGSREDIPHILSSGDYFLFPSIHEGFPNALIEAETSGLRCLTSDIITKQVVLEELCQSLSLKESPEIWAKELLSMKTLDNREIAVDMIKKGHLDIVSEMKQLNKIYHKLMGNE